ncbi:venom serine carboxypeptidase-like [Cydia fagiglandana]|uniref:venom serine carboxypeptidase-like n=1 Tax=Cydia fagiglandana TaxID=1458189 RepID=UPI002FEE2893
MTKCLFVAIVLQIILLRALCTCLEVQTENGDSGPGEPLFLSPYLERGDVAEARRLARVPLLHDLHVESYAGFFTVDKTYDSNHFFWYLPSMSANINDDPVILWLEGGPGGSGMSNVFMGNGPVALKNHTFIPKEYHWVLNHHMIYIDNPVGASFSFTKHKDGYCRNETQIAEHLYSSLTQFFQLFPELQRNEFFIAGESYGGKYVPALGYAIHKKNPTAETKINLQGLAIGNGMTDPENQLKYGEFLYQIGLIDLNQRKIFEEYQAKTVNYIRNGQWIEAFNTYAALILEDNSLFNNFTGFAEYSYYNYLHTGFKEIESNVSAELKYILKQNAFRKAIHVGNLKFQNGSLLREILQADVMKSVAPWLSELLDHYHCLVYIGQLDIIVAYPLTLNYLQKLKFSGSEEYRMARRSIWRVDGEIAGYAKQGGRLLEVLVRDAGHAVIWDKPKWAMDMIQRFTHNENHWDN